MMLAEYLCNTETFWDLLVEETRRRAKPARLASMPTLPLRAADTNSINWLRRRIRTGQHQFSKLNGSAFAKLDETRPGIISLKGYLALPTDKRRDYRVTLLPKLPDKILLRALSKKIAQTSPENEFLEQACGYVPGRGGREVVRQIKGHLDTGRRVVLRFDVTSFNETVDQALLLKILKAHLRRVHGWGKADVGLLVGLIESYLSRVGEALVFPGRGIGMGSPLTPWFTNLYLDQLDRFLDSKGYHFVRYGDDVAMFFETEKQAAAATPVVRAFIRDILHQEISESKWIIKKLAPGKSNMGIDFCLFHYTIALDGQVDIRIKDATLEKIRRKIRYLTRLPEDVQEENAFSISAYTLMAVMELSKRIGFLKKLYGLHWGEKKFSSKGWGYWFTLDAKTESVRQQLRELDAYMHGRLIKLEKSLQGKTSKTSKFYSRLRENGMRTFMDAWQRTPKVSLAD